MDFSNFSDDDWRNFSYSLLILVILISGFASRRDFSFKIAMKYLAIWSTIALFLIIIYSYRFEFSNFSNRFSREINPSKALVNQNGQIIINISQDGHFYTNATINGKTIRFMVDTGASDIAISVSDAKKIGIALDKLVFNKPYQTANGKSWGASINLTEINISGIKFTDIQASVNNSDMGTSLLGMGFLKRLKKYEVFQDQLILTI